ncbi:YgiT-type zinc finger protein [Salibacterium salarium]|uniref:YgiT-type zinc finger protein n=1 Tax=Salibacterium salarium TaxID=284579 RepID=A0A428N631_9BACI|nr:YgiT-type zinc finger protein [Salibacterium salarium]RSL33930.1 YgiT-type zinc finger protein [Salibacterium salarium]
MRAVKEMSHTMLEIPCRCGENADKRVGDVEHVVGSKKVTVKNVPHYYCDTCGTASYSSDVQVSDLLKRAYAENLNEISYIS